MELTTAVVVVAQATLLQLQEESAVVEQVA
jgi:hypothetical protein